MQALITKFVNHRNWIIVGVSNDTSKFGYKVFVDLFGAGYKVFGVNPKGGIVNQQKISTSLENCLKENNLDTETVVDFVTQPAVTEQALIECKKLGLKNIWMQPGAESKKAIEYCNQNGLLLVTDCAMETKLVWIDD